MRSFAAVIGGAAALAGYACYQALRKERGTVVIPLQRLARRHRSVKLAPAAQGGRLAAGRRPTGWHLQCCGPSAVGIWLVTARLT